MTLQKNKLIFLLLLSVTLGAFAIVLLYILNWSTLVATYQTHEGALGAIIAIVVRMGIVALMAIYTFYSWFKQEKQYFSDMPFLFGIFFLLLIFGKSLDLFIDFSYFHLDPQLLLLVMKARFLIAIFNLFPMIFLSIEMILFSFSLKERFRGLTREKTAKKTKLRILIIIIAIEIMIGMFILTIELSPILYPIIIVPSLITIVWVFYFAWKNQRLSQVNTRILTIGYGLYLISQISRPLVQFIIGESSMFVIIAETIDIIIFLIIFIGFYKKSNYSTKKQTRVYQDVQTISEEVNY